jgi:hypothetical protein
MGGAGVTFPKDVTAPEATCVEVKTLHRSTDTNRQEATTRCRDRKGIMDMVFVEEAYRGVAAAAKLHPDPILSPTSRK